jgi:hypothetical protein
MIAEFLMLATCQSRYTTSPLVAYAIGDYYAFLLCSATEAPAAMTMRISDFDQVISLLRKCDAYV